MPGSRKQLVLVLLFAECCAAGSVLLWYVLLARTTAAKGDPVAVITPSERRPRFGPDESKPIQDSHVGTTRDELVALLGEPSGEGTGFIGRRSLEDTDKCSQNLEWSWPSGRFLAFLHTVDGQWVCYLSLWVPKGCIICSVD